MSARYSCGRIGLEARPNNDMKQSHCFIVKLVSVFAKGPEALTHTNPITTECEVLPGPLVTDPNPRPERGVASVLSLDIENVVPETVNLFAGVQVEDFPGDVERVPGVVLVLEREVGLLFIFVAGVTDFQAHEVIGVEKEHGSNLPRAHAVINAGLEGKLNILIRAVLLRSCGKTREWKNDEREKN